MLFNSYEFIFLFLPAALAVFFLLGKASRTVALGWLVIVSLVFYAWWRPANVLIILTSLFCNYVFARLLSAIDTRNTQAKLGHLVLGLGIAFNVSFLGYFKYTTFLQTAMNDLFGTEFVLTYVVLPLGISFFTFQQIAFLIDVHGRNVEKFKAREFCLFVLFFPQLIAGPIVHFREMIPQFREIPCRFNSENLSVGLTLFVFGLFKKVVLADGIAQYVTPVYEIAATGGTISLFPAWIAAVGFTLQIYFDFSGYSDMACGLGRCIGIRLPLNFDSPLKATNIIDYWSRWHITLTRFLTAYVYNPLALWRTRKRMSKGLPGLQGSRSSVGAFLSVLAAPTIFTMFLSGLWHGAGYLFVLWGLLHGFYIAVNHAWRLLVSRILPDKERYERVMRPIGFVITFVSVAVAMILFRSTSVASATELISGFFGMNGIGLPAEILNRTGLSDIAGPILSVSDTLSATDFVLAVAWTFALLVIALLLPNSVQVLSRYQPVLEESYADLESSVVGKKLPWRPSLSWAVAISALAAASVLRLAGESEFLYWQF